MRFDLIAEVEDLVARSKGGPVEKHLAFLDLRNMLPEIIDALRELATLQGRSRRLEKKNSKNDL